MADATNMSNHKIVIILDKLIKKTLETFTFCKGVLCKQRHLFFFPHFTKLRHHSVFLVTCSKPVLLLWCRNARVDQIHLLSHLICCSLSFKTWNSRRWTNQRHSWTAHWTFQGQCWSYGVLQHIWCPALDRIISIIVMFSFFLYIQVMLVCL